MNKVYRIVTDEIIAALEDAQASNWQRPWRITQGLPLRENGQPYTGINTVLLFSAAAKHGYSSPYWLTFNPTGAYVRWVGRRYA